MENKNAYCDIFSAVPQVATGSNWCCHIASAVFSSKNKCTAATERFEQTKKII